MKNIKIINKKISIILCSFLLLVSFNFIIFGTEVTAKANTEDDINYYAGATRCNMKSIA